MNAQWAGSLSEDPARTNIFLLGLMASESMPACRLGRDFKGICLHFVENERAL